MPANKMTVTLWTKSYITLILCMLLVILNLHMLLSSFPLFVKKDLAATDFTVSLVTGAFALSAISSRLLVVPLMKLFNDTIILITGLAIATLNTILNVFVDSVTFLIILRIGFGIGFGITSTVIPTMVSRILPSQRMGEGIGFFGLAGSLAMSIGPIVGLNIMGAYGFSTLAWSASFVIILVFPLLFILGDPRHKQSLDQEKVPLPKAKVKVNFPMLLPAILNFLLSIIFSGLLSFMALYGEVLELEQVGLFFMFNAIALVIIRPISGRLFDRKGHIVVIIPAIISVIGSLLALSFATTIQMIIVSAMLYGFGAGMIQPTLQAWMLSQVTREDHGLINSIFFNSTDLGIALGALILGVISTAVGYASMYFYSIGFMLLFLLLYVMSLISSRRQAVLKDRL